MSWYSDAEKPSAIKYAAMQLAIDVGTEHIRRTNGRTRSCPSLMSTAKRYPAVVPTAIVMTTTIEVSAQAQRLSGSSNIAALTIR